MEIRSSRRYYFPRKQANCTERTEKKTMAHELPRLPFDANALDPHISAETLEYHHGKHHAAYVANLNKLIEGTAHSEASLEEIIRNSEGGLFNNAAQHYNHSFYWNCLGQKDKAVPGGPLADAIDAQWGGFDGFRDDFTNQAVTLFGSGWAWLVRNPDGSLEITQEPNAGCPLITGQRPLLTCDVWEHAYYLDYQNARPDYLQAFWKIVNWDFVAQNFGG